MRLHLPILLGLLFLAEPCAASQRSASVPPPPPPSQVEGRTKIATASPLSATAKSPALAMVMVVEQILDATKIAKADEDLDLAARIDAFSNLLAGKDWKERIVRNKNGGFTFTATKEMAHSIVASFYAENGETFDIANSATTDMAAHRRWMNVVQIDEVSVVAVPEWVRLRRGKSVHH